MLNHGRGASTSTSLVVERVAAKKGTGAGGDEGSSTLSAGSTASATTEELIFSMRAHRRIEAGEEVTHRYDDLDNTQLLLNYGFVAAEGALPASARLPLPLLFEAVAATRDNAVQLGQEEGHDMEEEEEDGGDASALIAEWDVGERWGDKTRACEKLLEMYGGAVSVSAEEPLPDALLTMVQLMLMPGDDFAEVLMGEDEDQGEGGGGRGTRGTRGS